MLVLVLLMLLLWDRKRMGDSERQDLCIWFGASKDRTYILGMALLYCSLKITHLQNRPDSYVLPALSN